LRHPGRCARPAPLALSPHPFALSLSKGFDKLSPNGFTKPSAAQALTVASGIPCLWVRSPHPHPFALSPLSVRLELLSVRPELVFIDADKRGYPDYFELALEKLADGGYILADNVLWKGRVTDPAPDARTRAIMDFNALVAADPRVEQVMLPVRDGLLLIRKKM